MSNSPGITAVRPASAIQGGRIVIEGAGFPVDGPELPVVRIGGERARIVHASPRVLGVIVPPVADGGRASVRIDGVPDESAVIDVASTVATGLHQVDNPVFDRAGNLYVTYSGTRGQEVPVSIFCVRPDGMRETFSSGIVNPTSMAIDPEGRLYVSSRFEGTVYRVGLDGSSESFASDLGVACGLTFAADGTLFVGDRSGTIFRVDRDGHARAFASLPPSVAAFHLALAPDGALHVAAPTLSSYDGIYRIAADGEVTQPYTGFGRPQGLAFDANGTLFVIEALAGSSGLYRIPSDGARELVLSGPGLIGVAFDPTGGLVVCSNDTAYRVSPSGA
ncbi:MAG: IPT/TIG domain-containing protein [Acidobacteriota bacterium]